MEMDQNWLHKEMIIPLIFQPKEYTFFSSFANNVTKKQEKIEILFKDIPNDTITKLIEVIRSYKDVSWAKYKTASTSDLQVLFIPTTKQMIAIRKILNGYYYLLTPTEKTRILNIAKQNIYLTNAVILNKTIMETNKEIQEMVMDNGVIAPTINEELFVDMAIEDELYIVHDEDDIDLKLQDIADKTSSLYADKDEMDVEADIEDTEKI